MFTQGGILFRRGLTNIKEPLNLEEPPAYLPKVCFAPRGYGVGARVLPSSGATSRSQHSVERASIARCSGVLRTNGLGEWNGALYNGLL